MKFFSEREKPEAFIVVARPWGITRKTHPRLPFTLQSSICIPPYFHYIYFGLDFHPLPGTLDSSFFSDSAVQLFAWDAQGRWTLSTMLLWTMPPFYYLPELPLPSWKRLLLNSGLGFFVRGSLPKGISFLSLFCIWWYDFFSFLPFIVPLSLLLSPTWGIYKEIGIPLKILTLPSSLRSMVYSSGAAELCRLQGSN